MARASVLACALVAATLVLLGTAPGAESTVSCGTVASSLSQCFNYIRGSSPLTSACCSGVRGLNSAASSPADRQTVCSCLKSLATKLSGVKYNLVSQVPAKCGVSIPYAISPSTDCSKVR